MRRSNIEMLFGHCRKMNFSELGLPGVESVPTPRERICSHLEVRSYDILENIVYFIYAYINLNIYIYTYIYN